MTVVNWSSGAAYEPFMGRWSRLVAAEFVHRLGVPAGARWVDVGCGTGALTAAILRDAAPEHVLAVDPSSVFVEHARAAIGDPRAEFDVNGAGAIPLPDDAADAVVSGLVLNFVPDPGAAVAEARRVARPGGYVAAYVWDYAYGMRMLRRFWDVATELDPAVAELDEARRFPLSDPDKLAAVFGAEVTEITVPTVFRDFDDYWMPFLGGVGTAPTYVASLTEDHRDALRDALRERLTPDSDGSIPLTARAWVVADRVS